MGTMAAHKAFAIGWTLISLPAFAAIGVSPDGSGTTPSLPPGARDRGNARLTKKPRFTEPFE